MVTVYDFESGEEVDCGELDTFDVPDDPPLCTGDDKNKAQYHYEEKAAIYGSDMCWVRDPTTTLTPLSQRKIGSVCMVADPVQKDINGVVFWRSKVVKK